MSDEQEKKPTSKFGSMKEQWETIGKRKKEPDMPQSVKTPEHLNAQTTKPPRKRQTVYLYEDLLRRVKHRIADTGEEISDVANNAIREFLEKEEGK